MEITGTAAENLISLQGAIQMTALRNALNLTAGTVDLLLQGVQQSRTMMENSVTPHKGANIDITV